jgi:prepilin-type N-terminal cleavage/methylation domain-containing protein
MAKTSPRMRAPRGFSLMEMMLVMVIIGILSSVAIPAYTRFSARAHRAEVQMVVGHMRAYFLGYYQANGRFPAVPSGNPTSSYNPPYPSAIPVGQPATWATSDTDWTDVPSPDGACRLRYQYAVDATGQTLVLSAIGDFSGVGPYTYTEAFASGVSTGPAVETPEF